MKISSQEIVLIDDDKKVIDSFINQKEASIKTGYQYNLIQKSIAYGQHIAPNTRFVKKQLLHLIK